jgi:TonB family protein
MTQKSFRTLLIVFSACALASCASKPRQEATSPKPTAATTSYTSNGEVDAQVVAAPEESRYRVTPGISFANPEPARLNDVPTYPPVLLVKRLDAIEVIARLIVNAAGSVETATVIQNSSQEQAFADATLTAVKAWTFSPLKRITGQVTEPLPFTQEYRFTFTQINGRAVVQSGARQ